MKYHIEDLGVQDRGDIWSDLVYVRRPSDGREFALGILSLGGMMLIDPIERTGQTITAAQPLYFGWAACQGADGAIYFAESGLQPTPVYRWNWGDKFLEPMIQRSFFATYTLAGASDGMIYMPDYLGNAMHRWQPGSDRIENCGDFQTFCQHIHDVAAADDGWIYVNGITYADSNTPENQSMVLAMNPKTLEKKLVDSDFGPLISSAEAGAIEFASSRPVRDPNGKVYIYRRMAGRMIWYELVAGRAVAADQSRVRITDTGRPTVFDDGSYIRSVDGDRVNYCDPAGRARPFDVVRDKHPLRIFSLASGGGRIWCGTVIPLQLSSYNIATGQRESWHNPTPTTGEIYNMVWANHKLYMGSYTEAWLTRLDPDKPWRKDQSIHANPAQLGRMKETGIPLYRPHGRAMDRQGNVYFSAHGSYGCVDSGISRINPHDDTVVSWIYPSRSFAALCYCDHTDELIVSSRRDGEPGLRLTIVNPHNGEIVWSKLVMERDGVILDLLHVDGPIVYGLHSTTATLFQFDMEKRGIVKMREELGLGHHCHNTLMLGLDDRIWGLTTTCVYAIDRDLENPEILAEYDSPTGSPIYRFGMGKGDDGRIYFPAGKHLMRIGPSDNS